MKLTIPTIPHKFGRRQFIKMSLSLMAASAMPVTNISGQSGTVTCQPYGQGLYGQGVYCGVFRSDEATLTVVMEAIPPPFTAMSFTGDLGEFALSEPEPKFVGTVQPGRYAIILADRNTLQANNIALIKVDCTTQHGQAVSNVALNRDDYTAEIPLEVGQHLTCTFVLEGPDLADDDAGKPAPSSVYLPLIFGNQIPSTARQKEENEEMTRLPIVNQDENQWGGYLNDFLNIAHYDTEEVHQAGQIKQQWRVWDVQVDFGAKGDGDADDTAAIQNALNEGGLVYLPPGTYHVTDTLVVTQSRTTLFGAGDASKITSFSQEYGIVVENGVQYTTFRDFALIGEAQALFNDGLLTQSLAKRLRAFLLNYDANNPDNDYVSTNESDIYTTIERVTIEDWCAAISSQAASYLLVRDCLIRNMVSYCEEGYGITSSTSKAYYLRNRFINTNGDRNGRHAIYVNGIAEDVWVVDNYIEGYERAPIASRVVLAAHPERNMQNYHYLHNKLVSCNYNPHSNSGAITLRCINYADKYEKSLPEGESPGKLENVVVEGNIIQNCDGRGISIDHARQVTIDNNIITAHKESSLVGVTTRDQCGNDQEKEDTAAPLRYAVYHKLHLEACEDVMVGQMSIEVTGSFTGNMAELRSREQHPIATDRVMSGVFIKNCARVSINQIHLKAQHLAAALEVQDSQWVLVQSLLAEFGQSNVFNQRAVLLHDCQNVSLTHLALTNVPSLTDLALISGESDDCTLKRVEGAPRPLGSGVYNLEHVAEGHGQFLDLYEFGTLTLTAAPIIQWDVSRSPQAVVTLTDAGEYLIENPRNVQDGAVYRLFINQGGGKTVRWGNQFRFADDTPPVLSNRTDLLLLTCLGNTLYGTLVPRL